MRGQLWQDRTTTSQERASVTKYKLRTTMRERRGEDSQNRAAKIAPLGKSWKKFLWQDSHARMGHNRKQWQYCYDKHVRLDKAWRQDMIAAMIGQSSLPKQESHKRSTRTGQSGEPYRGAQTRTGETEDRTWQYGLDSKVRRAKGG